MPETRYYLSDQDLEDRLRSVDDAAGDTDCLGEIFDPACGECAGCLRRMTEHYFRNEVREALLVRAAGLELADPSVIDIWKIAGGGEYHDWYGHYCTGETDIGGTPRIS